MAKGFSLSIYPWVYKAKFRGEGAWEEDYEEKPHLTPKEEDALSSEKFKELLDKRNSFPDMPLVNYTTQYGLGCFEGLKALPQPDGSLKLFRPDKNAQRMERSMKGLKMPAFPEEHFVRAVRTMVRKNMDLGFYPVYDPAWEKDNFVTGHSVYVRPFSYSEPAIGLGLSLYPWVVMVSTPVGAYFKPGNAKASTTSMIRAFPAGTGWIKCDANYVVPILAKKEVEAAGYMEAIFLDAVEHTYVEEGSSCNIFFYLKNGTLVTPALGDTILPGINRETVLTIAAEAGVKTEERRISIDEVLSDGKEAFVTGTAAGISYLESVTHTGKTAVFAGGKIGELTANLLKTLKGIQYGKLEDKHGWMVGV